MRKLLIKPGAEEDIALAFDWYESQRVTLGRDFLWELQARLDDIRAMPDSFQAIELHCRAARTKRFPYRIIFRVEPDQIAILAVAHTARDSDAWRERL